MSNITLKIPLDILLARTVNAATKARLIISRSAGCILLNLFVPLEARGSGLPLLGWPCKDKG